MHTQSHTNHLYSGLALAALGTGLFALKSIFIKLAYAEGLDTDSVLMLRMAIALPIYLFIIATLTHKRPVALNTIQKRLPWILFLGFIGYFLSSWLDLKGLEYISAQLERLTLFTYPFMIAFLGALFFKTPLTRRIIGSLIITYVGLWVVFYQELRLTGEETITGTLLVLGAALSYSFYALFAKRQIAIIGSLWFTSIAMSVSSVFVLIYYGCFHDFTALHLSTNAWIWVSLLAIVSTVLPSFMIAEAIARIGPAETSIVGTLGPIVTILLAVWILDEPFSLWHALGVLLVLSGVRLLTLRQTKNT